MREFKDSPFWAYIRKTIRNYNGWLKEIKTENDCLVTSGKGINAMLEYNDIDNQDIVTTMRAAVKFRQCTGEEYREALHLIRIVDQEFRHELMKMELMAAGEL